MGKKYSLYSPAAELRRRIYRRSRGSRLWAGVASSLLVLRVVRRVATRRPEVAAMDRLEPGQSITITAIAPPTRRQRKAARRAGSPD